MSWLPSDVDHVEETLQSDGFALIFGLFQKREAQILEALRSDKTDWEQTVKLRGELAGLDRIRPARIRQAYPSQSEKP